MADWRKVALAALVADGKIDNNEVKILRKELWADGKIDKDEAEFLCELRCHIQKKSKRVNPNFEKLFFKAVEENVLADGTIDAKEASWLEKMLLYDNKIDPGEKKFLARLKKSAQKVSPQFESLYSKCMAKK